MRSLIGILLLLVAVATAFDWHDPNDPVYDRVRIRYDHHGNLDISIPDEIDCRAKCPDVDMCDLGVCMLGCFDKDKDGGISTKEMQDALDKQLYWYERALTDDGKGWVAKFDGKDGSEKNDKIEFKEVIVARVACSDFQKAQDYICNRCTHH